MLLRAPLRSYISTIWPSIAQKHGINSIGASMPKMSYESFSKVEKVSHKLALAYAATISEEVANKSTVSEALDSYFQRDAQSFNSGDFLALGLFLYGEKDGSYTFKNSEASMFQFQLFQMLQNNVFSPAELCLILPIFKRSGMKLEFSGLRIELYKRLHQLVKEKSFDPCSTACIINLIVVLNKDPQLVLEDDSKQIMSVLCDARYSIMPIKASVKVMSLGVTRGLMSTQASAINLKRLEEGEIKELSLRETIGVLHYFNKTTNLSKDSSILPHILQSLSQQTPDTSKDLIDLVQSYSYLTDIGICQTQFYDKLIQIVNHLPSEDINLNSVCRSISFILSPGSSFFDSDESSRKLVHLFLYTIISYRFNDPNLEPCPDRSKLAEISKLVKGRSPKNEVEIRVYKELLNYFSPQQMSFQHILPHFQNPCLLFGHLCGNSIEIPSYITEDSNLVKPAPDIGEWFVVMGIRSSSHKDETNFSSLDELLSPRDLIKKTHLTTLGYKVVVVSSNDLVQHRNKIAETVLRWSFET